MISPKEMLNRYKRYIKYAIQYYLMEKPKGLDFTLRDRHLFDETEGKMSGYSKTDDKHVRECFEHLDFNKCRSLIDVGCGKGAVLREACKYPFERVAGFDIDETLIKTARRNFEILGLSDRVSLDVCDALNYDKYGSYDTFFLFNPFGVELMRTFLDVLLSQKGFDVITLCYYHMTPACMSVFTDTGRVTVVDKLFDPVRQYETYIMEIR